jgi:hypothetical protein
MSDQIESYKNALEREIRKAVAYNLEKARKEIGNVHKHNIDFVKEVAIIGIANKDMEVHTALKQLIEAIMGTEMLKSWGKE